MILVSACLCGKPCRYDGRSVPNEAVCAHANNDEMLQACPEIMGGLFTPRSPAEIIGGDGTDVLDDKAFVRNQQGENVTQAFILGAQKALMLCLDHGITQAILKAKSPSCGCGQIYDGTFSGRLIPGDGVTAALLKQNGIVVHNEISEWDSII